MKSRSTHPTGREHRDERVERILSAARTMIESDAPSEVAMAQVVAVARAPGMRLADLSALSAAWEHADDPKVNALITQAYALADHERVEREEREASARST